MRWSCRRAVAPGAASNPRLWPRPAACVKSRRRVIETEPVKGGAHFAYGDRNGTAPCPFALPFWVRFSPSASPWSRTLLPAWPRAASISAPAPARTMPASPPSRAGAPVNILRCGRWCEVVYAGRKGWASASYIARGGVPRGGYVFLPRPVALSRSRRMEQSLLRVADRTFDPRFQPEQLGLQQSAEPWRRRRPQALIFAAVAFPAAFAYKAPSDTDPGRGLNGSVGVPTRTRRIRLPVFPLSKDSCDAFPGLRGGFAPENKRKGRYATLRTRISGPTGRVEPAGRGARRAVQGASSSRAAARSPRSSPGASSRSPTASARTARRTSR